jgi:hypothetical protein
MVDGKSIVSACLVLILFSSFFTIGVLSLWTAYNPQFSPPNCTNSGVSFTQNRTFSLFGWLLGIGGIQVGGACCIAMCYAFLLLSDYMDWLWAKGAYIVSLCMCFLAVALSVSFGIVGSITYVYEWPTCGGFTYNFTIAAIIFAFLNPFLAFLVLAICLTCLWNLS